MARLLGEIEWDEALVQPVIVPEWEAEAKQRFAGSSDYLRRVAPLPWLRRTCAMWQLYPISRLPLRLADLTFLVVSQENSCRYCYGAARAHLRILGYSERMISQIERELQLAELDQKDQAFLRFCRQLARSNPRPAQAERDEMLRLGFSREEIAEAAFLVANHSFHNRVSTFIAAPPVLVYERLGRSWLGRLLRPMLAVANRKSMAVPQDFVLAPGEPFEPVLRPLAGLPAAYMLHEALTAAFDSPVLSRRIKVLVFAVVARILECRFCAPEALRLLEHEGFTASEAEACLSSLSSTRLDANETAILEWARETVRYQPLAIQKRTRALFDRIGTQATLEAVGIAALANSTVRIAMLAD
jgi:alkylhydroperoxidase family enzyme